MLQIVELKSWKSKYEKSQKTIEELRLQIARLKEELAAHGKNKDHLKTIMKL